MIEILKNERILNVYSNEGRPVRSFPISLGKNPLHPKTQEGDGRTPEGAYRIISRNPQSKFHLSFGINYPSCADAEKALREKRIRFFQYAAIRVCHLIGVRPPWKTPLGGYIMIHGESPEQKTGDWTMGCIALSNRDIESLDVLIKKGDIVNILP
ncbi:MAG: L,D-transpeptidase family protein [Clostridia bacterium]|nr:L,D-transpeptidase family protein [Clostridia bacterium]